MSQPVKIEEKLFKTGFDHDPEPHTRVIPNARISTHSKTLAHICPAEVYREDPAQPGRLTVSHENCLECGTCRQIAGAGSLEWKYPAGGKGIRLKHG